MFILVINLLTMANTQITTLFEYQRSEFYVQNASHAMITLM